MKWVLGLTHRAVAEATGVSPGAVGNVLARAAETRLDWATAEGLSEVALEERLYGQRAAPRVTRPLPDFGRLHAERSKPGVTLELLHLEYLAVHADGYQYTQFCERYREWLGQRGLTMRFVHVAGEKVFVDYSGKKPRYVDQATGAPIEVELFVAVLGASNYSFAEATQSQSGPDWIASHQRAFAFLGGVTAMVVPDQLKSGVTRACRYEPGIQRTYEEMASHYGTSVVPARPGKPRDKAKVEVGVQVVQRWVLARLRNQTFFSLEALNERIAALIAELNERTMRRYGESRRSLYERLDRPALRPLPHGPFEYGEWKKAKVNLDYHIEVDRHWYSVPSRLVRGIVDVRVSATTVEIFERGERVASHVRSRVQAHHTTVREHMPVAHQKHADWSPTRIIEWARTIGPATEALVARILATRPHPEQGYRSCLGILRLGKKYGDERLERACDRAGRAGACSYRNVESILVHRLDEVEAAEVPTAEPTVHENVRGSSYYH